MRQLRVPVTHLGTRQVETLDHDAGRLMRQIRVRVTRSCLHTTRLRYRIERTCRDSTNVRRLLRGRRRVRVGKGR